MQRFLTPEDQRVRSLANRLLPWFGVLMVAVTLALGGIGLYSTRELIFEQIASGAARRWIEPAARGTAQDGGTSLRLPNAIQDELNAAVLRRSIERYWLADATGRIVDASRPGDLDSQIAVPSADGAEGDEIQFSKRDLLGGAPLPRGVIQAVATIRNDAGNIAYLGLETDRSEIADKVFRFLEYGFASFAAILIAVSGFFGFLAHRFSKRRAAVAENLRRVTTMLADREEMLRRALKAARTAAWAWEAGQDSFTLSEQMVEMLGLRPDQSLIASSHNAAITHPDDLEFVKATFVKAIKNGSDIDIEYRIRHADGRYLWVHSVGAAVQDDAGRTTRLTGTLTDVSERRAAEDEVQRLRESQGMALALSRAGYYDVRNNPMRDEPARVEWSPRLREILGIADPNYIPRPGAFPSRVHPDEIERYRARIREAERTGETIEARIRLRHEHGQYIWVHIRSVHQSNAEGEPIRHIGFVRDITDEVLAEKALRESEQLHANVIAASEAGFFEDERDSRVITWSLRLKQILGFPNDFKPDYLSMARVMVPEDRVRLAAGVERMYADGKPLLLELRARHQDGHIIWLSLRSILKEGVGRKGSIGFVRDVSKYKQGELALQASEARFRALIENSADVVTLRDLDGRITYISPSCNAMFGLRPEEVVGVDNMSMVHPDDVEVTRLFVAGIAAGITDGRPLLLRIRHKDGHYVWVEAAIAMVPSPDAAARPQVLSISRDVTERIKREDELKAARDRLQALADELEVARRNAELANAAKSQFLAMMSHELRTPLTGILGMADLLMVDGLSTQQSGRVEVLSRSARSLLDLLNDILDLSKIEAGRLELHHDDFRLTRQIADVSDYLGPSLSKKSNALSVDTADLGHDVIVGDGKRYRQILVNLVGNANKFTNGGRITVSVRSRAEDDALVIETSVKDTGIGISEADVKRLFDPFTQAGDLATRHKGTGLGLAICKRLCEAMGGTIGVQSKFGEGATFTFTFRAQPGDATRVPAAVATDSASTIARQAIRSLRVLLAEDNETTRLLMTTVLTRQGHQVTAVADGAQALEAADPAHFDIVLMDMQMPVMDGDVATRKIRERGVTPDALPIIALTADALPEHHERYRDAGVDLVITKPVDWENLARAMDQLCDSSISPATTSDRAELDESLLNILASALPADALPAMMMRAQDHMKTYIADIGNAVGRGDLAAVKKSAHALKGIASQFGARRISTLAKEVEEKAVSTAEAGRALDLLNHAFMATQAAFKARLDRVKT